MTAWSNDIITYWFDRIGAEHWFSAGPDIDREIRNRFRPLWEKLRHEAAIFFVASPMDALAAIILFDQFPRNMFRHDADAFATDALSLNIAKLGLDAGLDINLSADERHFFYMPFMHSECVEDQNMSVELFDRLGNHDTLKYAIMHRDLIVRFGRFPHRNEILGRETLPEELEAVAQGSDW